MMKKLNLLAVLAFASMMALGTLPSCTYDPSEPPVKPEDTTTVRFKLNSTTTYEQSQLDTAGGEKGRDEEIGTKTTDVATVTDTNASFQGRTGVKVISHTDTTFNTKQAQYHQDTSGKLYGYNFGIGFVNNLAVLANYLPAGGADIGWTLIGNTKATAGTKWSDTLGTVVLSNIPTIGTLVIELSDTAYVANDTVIVVGTEQIFVKHFIHDIYLKDQGTKGLLAKGATRVEEFISPKLGRIIKEISRSATVTTAISGTTAVNGFSRTMVSHN